MKDDLIDEERARQEEAAQESLEMKIDRFKYIKLFVFLTSIFLKRKYIYFSMRWITSIVNPF